MRENWEEELKRLSVHFLVILTKISNWVTKVVDTMEAYTNTDTERGRGGREQKLSNDKTNLLGYIKSAVSNTPYMFQLNLVFNF